MEATEHLGNISEKLVEIKEKYYEQKFKLKEIEMANNQKYYAESLAVQCKISDALSLIVDRFNNKTD